MQRFVENFRPLNDNLRETSLEETIESAPKNFDDLWLFAYGSLMWDETLAHCETVVAKLSGWHRELCIWTVLARGTPSLPGLTLGLLPGGNCKGLAFRITKAEQPELLKTIWEREMWTDVYVPTWVSIDDGERMNSAITFTTNNDSAQFAGNLPLSM